MCCILGTTSLMYYLLTYINLLWGELVNHNSEMDMPAKLSLHLGAKTSWHLPFSWSEFGQTFSLLLSTIQKICGSGEPEINDRITFPASLWFETVGFSWKRWTLIFNIKLWAKDDENWRHSITTKNLLILIFLFYHTRVLPFWGDFKKLFCTF